MSPSRQIVKSRVRGVTEVQEAISTLLCAELIDPSEKLYIQSAWITDVPVLDNTAGTYSIDPDQWEERWIFFSEVLVALMRRGTVVHLKANEDHHNDAFVERITARAERHGVAERLSIRRVAGMHSKGIVANHFALRGSMNLTYSGLEKSEETVDLDVDNEDVSSLRLEVSAEWGGGEA